MSKIYVVVVEVDGKYDKLSPYFTQKHKALQWMEFTARMAGGNVLAQYKTKGSAYPMLLEDGTKMKFTLVERDCWDNFDYSYFQM